MIPLILLLAAAVLLYMCLSHWARRDRTVLGIKSEIIASADDSAEGMSTLRSKRYGLVGRPDQLIRVGRMLIPVEQKPTARRMQQSHVLQIAAQCLLVEEVYGVRPSHRLLVLAGGKQERVEFTPALEGRLLHTMAQMRALLRADAEPGPRWVSAIRDNELMPHRGVAVDDPRNAGPIEYFRPKPVTRESLRRTLTAIMDDKDPADVEARIEETMQRIARGPIAPDPPVSQSLDAVADPWYGLGTHPDIIEVLWDMDDSLPQRCRWVFWGGPSLVHPETGVVFAIGMGTIGIVFRLPPQVVASADPQVARVIQKFNRAPTSDIGPAGPEWRLIGHEAPRALWCRAAYDFAGEIAH